MALWKPDQTFYPSARMAMKAPREKLGYVVTFNPDRRRTDNHDALCVLDLDPASTSLCASRRPHRDAEPSATSCITSDGTRAARRSAPTRPHPHVERRYLLVPGLRSSRIYIIDTKPDPRKPKIVKVIEAEEIARTHRLQPPAYDSLRPRRDLRQRARRSRRRRPRRNFPARPRELRRARAMGSRSRTAVPRLRFLVASRLRRRGHQRMGHARTWSRTA